MLLDADGRDLLICVCSDGAGSAPRSQDGSRIVCDAVVEAVESWWSGNPTSLPSTDLVTDWLFAASASITERAEADSVHPKIFACTMLGAVVSALGVVYFQVGDGVIVEAQESDYAAVFWPEITEAANLTYFVTDENWPDHLQIAIFDHIPLCVALLTDGLQFLVLDYQVKAAHQPFFSKLFAQLESAHPEGVPQLCEALAVYLGSDPINSRTDDDKTLILASRRD